jgi:serine/threonine protein kinase
VVVWVWSTRPRTRGFIVLSHSNSCPRTLPEIRQALARFQREAQAASALNHPNICTIYDIGEQDVQAFIAMEFLDGMTLKHRIGARPLEIEAVLSMRSMPLTPSRSSIATSQKKRSKKEPVLCWRFRPSTCHRTLSSWK